ncbi:MAG: putative T7SS-secreted protein, partial [Pseudonocardiaceae bacterium]
MTAFGPVAAARPGFEALGFDPAPGQLASIESVGQRFTVVSRALGDAHQALTRIGRADDIWQGAAAQAFQNTVGELPGYLDKAHQSLGEASRALRLWHTDLASMQQRAADLEAGARTALQALEQAQANPDLGLGGQYFSDPGSLQAAQQRLDAAFAAVRQAETELEAVREQARRLLAQHTELADEVAQALDRAREIAPEEPGFFERLGETLGRALDDAVEGIRDSLVALAEASWQLIEDNANLIAAVSDVLADLSTIVGAAGDIYGFFPTPVTLGLDTAFNVVGLGLQGLALGGHLLAR